MRNLKFKVIALLGAVLLALQLAFALANLGSGLMASWSFNEGSGLVAGDISGNANDGSLLGGPAWVVGKAGKALSFDGVDDYIQIPHSSSLAPLPTHTIALWIKPSIILQDRLPGDVAFLEKRSDYMLRYKASGELAFSEWQLGIGYENALYPSTLSAGQWYHVAGTYDGTTARLYLNGVLVASKDMVRATSY